MILSIVNPDGATVHRFYRGFSLVKKILTHNIETFGSKARLSKRIIASNFSCVSSFYRKSIYFFQTSKNPCIPLKYIVEVGISVPLSEREWTESYITVNVFFRSFIFF